MSLGEIDYSAIAMSQQTGSFEALNARKPPTNLDSDTDDDLPHGQNQIVPDQKLNPDVESKRPLPSPQVDCLSTDAC